MPASGRLPGPLYLAALLCLALASAPAAAHPLGENSITHFSMLHLHLDRLEVDLILDIAEYPTATILRDEIDTDRDGIDSPDEQQRWLDRKAVELAPQLKLSVDGQPVALEPMEHLVDTRTGQTIAPGRLIVTTPGVANLPTYRLIIRYRGNYPAPLGGQPHTLAYEDNTFPGRRGLMRILLERTSLIDQLPHADDRALAELSEGGIPEAVRTVLAQRGSGLSDEAMLKPGKDGQSWFIHDGPRRYLLEAKRGGLGIHRLPRVTTFPPRPDYWDECRLDPFIYEQYDPGHMPYERETSLRFQIEEIGADPTSPGLGAGLAAEPDPEALAAMLARLNDPRNDPAIRSPYQRNADRLIGLLQSPGGLWVFLTITGLAFAYGAIHALMPGHAKTLVAAYLISRHGTWWHAVVLAVVVTITHTALVVILGLVIWAFQATRPDLGPMLQLWLGVLAGLLVAVMGLALAWRAATGRTAHHHHHEHMHEHTHTHARPSWLRTLFTHSHPHPTAAEHSHSHSHSHPHNDKHTHHHQHEHHPIAEGDRITIRLLILMGITGGIVPCPTATIMMLLGIGANVVAGALYAIGIFSLGLALTLMAIGFLALGSRRFAARLLADTDQDGRERLSRHGHRLMLRILPAVSGLVVFALGAAIAMHYLYYLHTGAALFSWIR